LSGGWAGGDGAGNGGARVSEPLQTEAGTAEQTAPVVPQTAPVVQTEQTAPVVQAEAVEASQTEPVGASGQPQSEPVLPLRQHTEAGAQRGMVGGQLGQPQPLLVRQGSESDASLFELSSVEGIMGAEAPSALAAEEQVRLPVRATEGACMIAAENDLVPSPLPAAVCDALADGEQLGADVGGEHLGADVPAHAVPSEMRTDNAHVRTEQHRARMSASRSLSTGMLEDKQRGTPEAGMQDTGQGAVVYGTHGQPLSHPFNDNESRLSWHLANRHYSGLPQAHRGRAAMAVGARTGGGGLRLKGMGVAGAGLLDYSSFGIPPGEIRRMSVNHVGEWLRMVGLEELSLFFRDAAVDGAGLLQLRQLSTTDADTFYSTAESKLGIRKFGLILRLADCLQCL